MECFRPLPTASEVTKKLPTLVTIDLTDSVVIKHISDLQVTGGEGLHKHLC